LSTDLEIFSDATTTDLEIFSDATTTDLEIFSDATTVDLEIFSDATTVDLEIFSDATTVDLEIYSDAMAISSDFFKDEFRKTLDDESFTTKADTTTVSIISLTFPTSAGCIGRKDIGQKNTAIPIGIMRRIHLLQFSSSVLRILFALPMTESEGFRIVYGINLATES
jgi:hypothetical protein